MVICQWLAHAPAILIDPSPPPSSANHPQTNTVLQFGVLTLALSRALWDVPSAEIFEPLCWLTGATTVGSGLTYLVGDGRQGWF